MGKIGVISDVHGNLQALEAILGLFAKEKLQRDNSYRRCGGYRTEFARVFGKKTALPNVTMLLGNHDRDFC